MNSRSPRESPVSDGVTKGITFLSLSSFFSCIRPRILIGLIKVVAKMNTRFQQGQRVVALSSVQGMQEGEEYDVMQVQERRLFCGNFVTYVLMDERGRVCVVGNGHLLLGEVPS